MTVILAIDPGSEQSAWLVYNAETAGIRAFAKTPNDELLGQLRIARADIAVIEQMAYYGMAVGREVFDTVHWAGRFTEALESAGTTVAQLGRKAVVGHLCNDAKAKDSNVRLALIDRFGGREATRKGGVLYGISKDVWSALAIGVAWAEGVR